MGPRHYSRGNRIQIQMTDLLTAVSMGPRHYSRGNDMVMAAAFCAYVRFQWGHDITVVETPRAKIDYFIDGDVSMGPRHYSRGNILNQES